MAIRGLVSVNERQARKLSTLVNGNGSNAKIRSKPSSGRISIEAKIDPDPEVETRKKVVSSSFKCGDNLYWDEEGRLESSGGGGTLTAEVVDGWLYLEIV